MSRRKAAPAPVEPNDDAVAPVAKKQQKATDKDQSEDVALPGARVIDEKRSPSKESPKWEALFDSCLITRSFLSTTAAATPSTYPQIAAFDMDATLIKVKSGSDFPVDEKDWEWLYPSVPKTLQSLYLQGYDIVIFTNQNGIGVGKKRDEKLAKQLQLKIDALMDSAHVPITTYMSCDKDRFRKPSRGMFDFMLDNVYEVLLKRGFTDAQLRSAPALISETSFYVGDACARGGLTAGDVRKGKVGPQKDHSGADYGFAVNAFGYVSPTDRNDQLKQGQRFYAPEEFFLGKLSHQPFDVTKGSTSPYDFILEANEKPESIADSPLGKYLAQHKSESQLVILCALPASGKTTFTLELMSYIEKLGGAAAHWVNRDTLKTPQKCIQATEKALKDKQIVIVDNTNVDEASRKSFIEIANKFKVPYHCVLFEVNVNLSRHLNLVRTNYFLGERERLPGVAINMANSKFKAPTQASEKYTTFTTRKHFGPDSAASAKKPRMAPPAGFSPATTAGTDGPSKDTLATVGPVTASRTLEDCYYQVYDH